MPAGELAKSISPAGAVANHMLGPLGGKLIGSGIMISVFGACNAYSMTGARVLFALAEEGSLPKGKIISKVNKRNVPGNALIAQVILACVYALIAQAILACVYALSGQFNLLTDFAIFSIWIFIVLSFIGVIILRRKQLEIERSYRVALYPLVPIVAIASGSFVLINLLFTNTMLALGGILITLLGLPILKLKGEKFSEAKSLSKKVTYIIV